MNINASNTSTSPQLVSKMTSRFVSGGTILGDGDSAEAQTPHQQQIASSSSSEQQPTTSLSSTSSQWEAAQRALEEQRRQREATRLANATGGGEKSLYEVLQENKAAKQAAFEEANRLRNQFRALDDDEVDFLDGVVAQERQEEEMKKREVEKGLERFKEAQKKGVAAAIAATGADAPLGQNGEDVNEWSSAAASRKRKREKDVKVGIKGLKRRTSEQDKEEDGEETSTDKATATKEKNESKGTLGKSEESQTTATKGELPPTKPAAAKPKLGLVDYGSDNDDDD